MTVKLEDIINEINAKSINLIDVRDQYKYNISHIEGAINIPSNFLITNPAKYLNKNKVYYLYCYNGHISRDLCNELNYLGYNTKSISGGYNYYLLIK